MMILLAALLCSATQEIENPEYKHWAAFKVGSFVKYKNETSVCPSGVQPSSTGSILGLSSAQCSTSGGEGDPLRLPLYTVLGFVGIALGRRAIRKSRRRQ